MAGNYTVTSSVTDTQGAYSNASLGIRVYGPLTLGLAVAPNPGEVGVPVEVATSISGGIDVNRTFGFSGFGLGCAAQSCRPVSCTPSSPGNLTLRASVTDVSGSAQSNPVPLRVYPRLSVQSVLAAPGSIDLHATTNLTVRVSGGVGPLNYAWGEVPLGCAGSDRSTIACQPTSAVAYVVEVEVTDSLGVSGSAQTNLTVNTSTTVQPPGGGGGTGSSPVSSELVYIAIGAAVAVVIVLAVLLLRGAPHRPSEARGMPTPDRRGRGPARSTPLARQK